MSLVLIDETGDVHSDEMVKADIEGGSDDKLSLNEL